MEYTQNCIKDDSKELLNLARKEICLTCKEYSRGYQEGLKLGREDVLKDLPKWKKCVGSTGPFIDYNLKGEEYLYLNDYVIKISDLEKLPKE